MTSNTKTQLSNIDDVEVGKIYEANFGFTSYLSPKTASPSFLKKYASWDLLDGKKVLVIEKTTVNTMRANLPVVKFQVLPDNTDPDSKISLAQQTNRGTIGEWCLCSPHYLYKIHTQNNATCTCNLWTTGCVCGIFKSEKSKKK